MLIQPLDVIVGDSSQVRTSAGQFAEKEDLDPHILSISMPTHPRVLAFKNLTRLACPLEHHLVCAPTIHPVMLYPSHARYPLSLADFMETEDSKKKKKRVEKPLE